VVLKNKISFRADGSPYSEQFDDIYFDAETGAQQSAQVFIEGNSVEQRLLVKKPFTIGETGFGTGLNFLLILELYQKLSRQQPLAPLTFISSEKYPLTRAELKKSLASLPALNDLSPELINQYPENILEENSNKRLELSFFNKQVTLILLFEDTTMAYSKLRCTKHGLVDVWFLDGFSPVKNPEMWQETLFEQLARLSKAQASISTFTISDRVRRSLMNVGFRVNKNTENGGQKEFLIGKFQQGNNLNTGYKIRPSITKPQHVSIIGGGIASACAAYILTLHGIKVTIYCKDNQLAQGASSNDIAALYPLIHQQKDDISNFYQQAFEYAIPFYKKLLSQGYHFDHDWCGLLDIAYKEPLVIRQKHFEHSNIWPKSFITSVDKSTASKLAGIELPHGGLFYPKAGWIAPRDLVTQLIKAAKVTSRLRIETNHQITELKQETDKSWQLITNKGAIRASIVVMCGGAEAIPLKQMTALPLTSVRGQVTTMASNEKMSALSTVICHKGYITPANKKQHCIGATFDKNSFDIDSRTVDDEYNLSMLERCLPQLTSWSTKDITRSKARLRCTTPDHLPLVGAMPNVDKHRSSYAHLAKDKNWRYQTAAPCIDNLYLMTGLGARGLCSAPLLAEILKDDLCGTPYSIETDMLFNLAPNRFIIRDLIKNK